MAKGNRKPKPQPLTQSDISVIEKALSLIDDDEAIAMIEGQADVAVLAEAVPRIFSLMYSALVQSHKIRNTPSNRAHFAKGQILAAKLLQVAFASGMKAGAKQAEETGDA